MLEGLSPAPLRPSVKAPGPWQIQTCPLALKRHLCLYGQDTHSSSTRVPRGKENGSQGTSLSHKNNLHTAFLSHDVSFRFSPQGAAHRQEWTSLAKVSGKVGSHWRGAGTTQCEGQKCKTTRHQDCFPRAGSRSFTHNQSKQRADQNKAAVR